MQYNIGLKLLHIIAVLSECEQQKSIDISEVDTHGAHQWIKDADSKRRATCKRLGHVQLSVWVVVIILVQELHVGIIACNAALLVMGN